MGERLQVTGYLSKPLDAFSGDPKNIAALARVFTGLSLKAYMKENGEVVVTAP